MPATSAGSYTRSASTATRDSASLLNLAHFTNPFAYELKVATGSVGESRPVNVDLVETFNYLLGLDAPFKNPLAGMVVRVPEDVEAAAEKLRRDWKLGLSALSNVLELIEEHQVKIYDLEAHDSFDGLSGWAGQIPVIVANKRFPADRKRFTVLHELGHLLLVFEKGLMPKDTMKKKDGHWVIIGSF